MEIKDAEKMYKDQLCESKAVYEKSLMDIEKNFNDAVLDFSQHQSKILAYIIMGLVVATICINAFVVISAILLVGCE